jgi:myosin-1
MPLVKLGYLLIRTIAKPVAAAIKRQARDHPTFKRACISVAQSYHRTEVRLKRGLADKKRLIPLRRRSLQSESETAASTAAINIEPEIKPLDEQKAVDVGSEFIGEGLVFLVAGTLLVLDQLSSRQKESERRAEIERRFTDLYDQLDRLKKATA